MKGFQCKCGKIVGSNTGESFFDCEGCEECKTTFAHGPKWHRELKEHDWKIRYNETTGKPYKICKDCHHIDRESYEEAKKQ